MPARRPNKQTHLSRPLAIVAGMSMCCMVLVGLKAPDNSTPTPTSQAHPAQSADNSPTDPNTQDGVKECVVTFLTGRKLTGLLINSGIESVVLRINGIDTTYRRSRIASIHYLPSIEVRFKILRDSLPDTDIDGRLLLVDWLRDRRAYGLAVKELESILTIEPNHAQAKILKTWLDQHLKLSQNRTGAMKSTPPTSSAKAIRRGRSTIPTLTPEQINLIQVYEIDLENPPKFRIDDSTIKTLMTRSPDTFPVNEQERESILDGTDLDKLKLLFRHKARDLYPQIRILEDPESFKFLKRHIAGKTGWMINSCATVRCHGGENAGEFRLISYNPNSPQSLYTNFIVIDQYEMKDGSALINHTDPERSPLIHLGLVRSRSLYPHPDIDPTKHGRDWRPVFRSTKATNFRRTIDWIRSLYTPRPSYGFKYPPSDPPEPPSNPDP